AGHWFISVREAAGMHMMPNNQYRVSVVVPTFKRHALLMRCLTALLAQDFDATDYEIIIVDDAACDETRLVVEDLAGIEDLARASPATTFQMQQAKCRGVINHARTACPCHDASNPAPTLRYIPVTGAHGPAAARNAGWRVARGEIIAFTDDDCIPTPGWLRAGLAAFTDDVVGISGRIIVPLQCIPTDYELNAAQLAIARFVTANSFYRRACLARIGGFDERFTSAWREDSDVYFTLLERYAGEAIPCACLPCSVSLARGFVYAPDAVVIHPLRPAQWGVSLSQQRKSMFNALLYKKHPTLYRENTHPAPPSHYYALMGALL